LEKTGFDSCVVSEITIAELKYGIEKSFHKEKNRSFLSGLIKTT